MSVLFSLLKTLYTINVSGTWKRKRRILLPDILGVSRYDYNP